MQPLERELYEHTTGMLNELAWQMHYPVNPGVGVWCLIEAFRAHGADVKVDERKRTARFRMLKEVRGRGHDLRADASFQDLLKGWGYNPVGSLTCLYDSICAVYDLMEGKAFFRKKHERENWFEIRNRESREIRRTMEKLMFEYFARHQEHMLVSVSGEVPKLREPRIFFQVLKDFPLDILASSVFNEARMGPCADTLLDIDWDFDADYHPSKSTMIDFFSGKYLTELAKQKEYATQFDEDPLRCLVRCGFHALRVSHCTDWGESIKNPYPAPLVQAGYRL
jgi:hypothetical protein